MAAGVTIRPGQMAPFRAHLFERLAEPVQRARALTSLAIDAAITGRAATAEFYHEVERAGPFGSGNPTPIFALPGHKVKFTEVMGPAGHVRTTLVAGDGARLRAVAFRAAGSPLGQALLHAGNDAEFHIAGCLNLDHWQGMEQVQLRITDAAVPA
jgi:single-stranded-DNA-specific exonuclease